MKEFIKKVIKTNNERIEQLEKDVKTFETFFVEANESDKYSDSEKTLVSKHAKAVKDTLNSLKTSNTNFEKKYKHYLV